MLELPDHLLAPVRTYHPVHESFADVLVLWIDLRAEEDVRWIQEWVRRGVRAGFVYVQRGRDGRLRREPRPAVGERVFIQDGCGVQRLEREARVLVVPFGVR